ncbi:ABC transporter substrate-binding protein [Chromobacterium haemolyticum]|uniref:ABC transporter substrate-binding protein n=1 Tax=Chromobacterium haemolyticum TaxID=394935 RepID=UPI0040561385
MNRVRSLSALCCALGSAAAWAALPAGYPATYQNLVDAAVKEGKVVVYSATDSAAARPLIKDFQALYPGIKVEYHDMNSTEIYNRFISENAANSASADVVWSSAMDLQVKFVNDGYAASYASPEAANIPAWAHYQQQAYGTTYEPVAIVYNKRLLKPEEIPQTRADLVRILKANPARFKGKVTTYDVEKSGVGFNFLTQDVRHNANGAWELARTLGATGVKLQTSTGAMMERISSGENLIGYNILGSYAYAKAKKDPAIGYVYPKDYTQVVSRLAIISKKARNPGAARLWLDYLLSKRGQSVLANQSELFSLRSDVSGAASIAALNQQLGGSAKPIQVGTGLLVYLDQAKRLDFMRSWQQALKK